MFFGACPTGCTPFGGACQRLCLCPGQAFFQNGVLFGSTTIINRANFGWAQSEGARCSRRLLWGAVAACFRMANDLTGCCRRVPCCQHTHAQPPPQTHSLPAGAHPHQLCPPPPPAVTQATVNLFDNGRFVMNGGTTGCVGAFVPNMVGAPCHSAASQPRLPPRAAAACPRPQRNPSRPPLSLSTHQPHPTPLPAACSSAR